MSDPLAAQALRAQWRGRDCFVMLEAGLPNLGRLLSAAAQLRQAGESGDAPRRLHYIAITPLQPDADTLARWLREADAGAAVDAVGQALAAQWPVALPGFHRLSLEGGGMIVTLIMAEVAEALAQLSAQADVMHVHADIAWSPVVIKWLGRLAAPQAMLTASAQPDLFSASLPALRSAGFADIDIEQSKQESRLHAIFSPRWKTAPAGPRAGERHAIVIGAGLAGAAICENLSARGWRIDLIEQHAGPAQEASGNAAGIFMPQLTRDDSPAARLSRAAYLYALQSWRRLGGVSNVFEGALCGALQCMRESEQEQSHENSQKEAQCAAAREMNLPAQFARWVDADEASALLGFAGAAGWLFPQAGWLHPGGLCAALLRACGDRLRTHFDTQLTDLQREAGQWRAFDHQQRCIAAAPVLILASGRHARQFSFSRDLPLDLVRGQVTHVPAQSLPRLPLVLCGDGYLTPANGAGVCSLGATYEPDAAADDLAPHQRGHAENLARLHGLVPSALTPLLDGSDGAHLDGRAGVRCVSPDRLPLVGALPDHAALNLARPDAPLAGWPRLPQAYGLLAYASRGVVWSALAAELLAAQLDGEPLPLPRDLAAALDPARFAWKAARRPAPDQ